MRRMAIVGLLGPAMISHLALAEPRLDAGGFVGVGVFPGDTELGNSWADEQVPRTAPVFGARLAWVAVPMVAGVPGLRLAAEGELAVATSSTGDADGRAAYFAPVFGWRAHARLELARWASVRPHLVAGAGGETVASGSPFMAKETDPVAYWGPGVTFAVAGRWQARIDVRHGVMASRDGGLTSTLELQFGITAHLGDPVPRPVPVPVPVPVSAPPPPSPPSPPPPPPDRDGDHVVDASDACADAAEDADGFEDADGCPDPDNDHDTIDDTHDRCPVEAETPNGVDDADGCPDVVPDDVQRALAVTVRFGRRSARLSRTARRTLAPVLAALLAHPALRLTVTGRADAARDADLGKRRAEAVKWYLVDQGVAEDRVTTTAGGTGAPMIDLALTRQ